MKFIDKKTSNILTVDDPFVIAQMEKRAERYEPITEALTEPDGDEQPNDEPPEEEPEQEPKPKAAKTAKEGK